MMAILYKMGVRAKILSILHFYKVCVITTSFYAQVAVSVLFILLVTTVATTAMKETRRGDKNSPTLCDDKQGELGCIKQQGR